MGLVTRRKLLTACAGLTLGGALLPDTAQGLTISPRSVWGSDLPPKGPLEAEDVKFLIVHHSASRNGHSASDVPGILRSWFNFHTGPEKGWNDIAYNFVIDSEGGIWEGRQGSIDGPVAGDATGGNQGFTQLVCVIGDYNTAHPTQASLFSLVQLLAWLADRYAVSTSPGAEVAFVSEGSNKWPAGTTVTTPTITGHRTMSKTSCPGDNLYSYVVGALQADVETVRNGGSPVATTTTTTKPTTTTTEPTTTTEATATTSSTSYSTSTTITTTANSTTSTTSPVTSNAPSVTSPAPPSTAASSTPTTVSVAGEPLVAESSSPLLIGAGALVALSSGLLIWRHNRMNR